METCFFHECFAELQTKMTLKEERDKDNNTRHTMATQSTALAHATTDDNKSRGSSPPSPDCNSTAGSLDMHAVEMIRVYDSGDEPGDDSALSSDEAGTEVESANADLADSTSQGLANLVALLRSEINVGQVDVRLSSGTSPAARQESLLPSASVAAATPPPPPSTPSLPAPPAPPAPPLALHLGVGATLDYQLADTRLRHGLARAGMPRVSKPESSY
jgi:hypothetical protein